MEEVAFEQFDVSSDIRRIRTRQFEEKDLEQVLEIEQAWPPSNRHALTTRDALVLHRENPAACLVAEKDDRIVGFMFGRCEGGKCKVKFTQVALDYIGLGIIEKMRAALARSTKKITTYK